MPHLARMGYPDDAQPRECLFLVALPPDSLHPHSPSALAHLHPPYPRAHCSTPAPREAEDLVKKRDKEVTESPH